MDAAARQRVLLNAALFRAVPGAELAVLGEMMRTERYSTGSTVVQAGENADLVFVVAKGVLSVHVPGREQPVRLLREGDVIGEYGMVGDSVRTATIVADEESVLLSLDYPRFREYLLRFPEALWVLFTGAVERLLDAERRPA